MGNQATIFAEIDPKLRRALFHKLMDDGIYFKDWLAQKAAEYVKAKPKGRQPSTRKEA